MKEGGKMTGSKKGIISPEQEEESLHPGARENVFSEYPFGRSI